MYVPVGCTHKLPWLSNFLNSNSSAASMEHTLIPWTVITSSTISVQDLRGLKKMTNPYNLPASHLPHLTYMLFKSSLWPVARSILIEKMCSNFFFPKGSEWSMTLVFCPDHLRVLQVYPFFPVSTITKDGRGVADWTVNKIKKRGRIPK